MTNSWKFSGGFEVVDEEEQVEEEREGRMVGGGVVEVRESRSAGVGGRRWMLTINGTLLSWCSLDERMDGWTRWFRDVVEEFVMRSGN